MKTTFTDRRITSGGYAGESHWKWGDKKVGDVVSYGVPGPDGGHVDGTIIAVGPIVVHGGITDREAGPMSTATIRPHETREFTVEYQLDMLENWQRRNAAASQRSL